MPYPAERIAVLVPTRGRPGEVLELARHLALNSLRPEAVALWLYADEGDQATLEVVAQLQAEGGPLAVHAVVEPDVDAHGTRFNRLREAMPAKADVYAIASDKMRLQTVGWDEVLRQAFRATPDGLLMAFARDQVNQGRFGAFFYLSEAWAQCTGRLTTDWFPFWFDDTWANEVGQYAGRWKALPIQMEMAAGPTQRMFQTRFWELFFHATRPLRVAEAQRILAKAHEGDPQGLAQALEDQAAVVAAEDFGPAHLAQRLAMMDRLEEALAARRLGPQPVPPPEDGFWRLEAKALAWLREAQQESGLSPERAALLDLAIAHSGEGHRVQLEALREAILAARWPEAEAAWALLRERFPFRPEAQALWGVALRQQGRLAEALALAQDGQQRFPQWPVPPPAELLAAPQQG